MTASSSLDATMTAEDSPPRLPRLARLHPWISRFLGYRPTPPPSPHDPLPFPPFSWIAHLPPLYEKYIFGFVGSFLSLLLIQIAMTYASSAFSAVYHSPIIIGSFGASAVLVFGEVEVPLSQPRNLIGGHFVSALTGTCITKLFGLINSYDAWVSSADSGGWHPVVIINGCLSMATALLLMTLLKVVHPPAGATALGAAVTPSIVHLSWRYLPVVLTSSLIMLGTALLVNNLGRRRYPSHWWGPHSPPAR